jgi:hypothetical protein
MITFNLENDSKTTHFEDFGRFFRNNAFRKSKNSREKGSYQIWFDILKMFCNIPAV